MTTASVWQEPGGMWKAKAIIHGHEWTFTAWTRKGVIKMARRRASKESRYGPPERVVL